MSKNQGRALDPSRVNQCRDCARDVLPTDLGIAEHRAYHLDHAALYTDQPVTWRERAEAWEAYAHAIERDSDARVQAAVEHVDDERRRLLEDVATRDEVIESLTADYDHLLGELRQAQRATT